MLVPIPSTPFDTRWYLAVVLRTHRPWWKCPRRGYVDILATCLEREADVETKNLKGRTARRPRAGRVSCQLRIRTGCSWSGGLADVFPR